MFVVAMMIGCMEEVDSRETAAGAPYERTVDREVQ